MEKHIIWVSLRVPYDSVPHAGGKTHNFYLKKLAQSNVGKITLVTLGNENERGKVDFADTGVDAAVHYHPNKGFARQFWRIINLETQFNKFNRYGGLLYNFDEFHIMSTLKKLKKDGYDPNIVILQWTNIILLIDKVRNCSPMQRSLRLKRMSSFCLIREEVSLKKNGRSRSGMLTRQKRCAFWKPPH